MTDPVPCFPLQLGLLNIGKISANALRTVSRLFCYLCCLFGWQYTLFSFWHSLVLLSTIFFVILSLRLQKILMAEGNSFKKRFGPSVYEASYKPRFEYGPTIDDVWGQDLPAMARPAIGRNPERLQWACYMCQKPVDGEFKDRVCAACAVLNATARERIADLSHKVCVVTGGRIKIGREVCLRLLRNGAIVVLTTRFPCHALRSFRSESDFASFAVRLHVFELDLRSLPAVMAFAQLIVEKFQRIDCLINNAAQTIRRPPAYYAGLVQQEAHFRSQLLAAAESASAEPSASSLGGLTDYGFLLHCCVEPPAFSFVPSAISSNLAQLTCQSGALNTSSAKPPKGSGASPLQIKGDSRSPTSPAIASASSSSASTTPSMGGDFGWASSAALSPVLPSDYKTKDEGEGCFPPYPAFCDQRGEPLDLRQDTSWTTQVGDVHPLEMLEVQMVNVTAPFTLVSVLGPLLKHPKKTEANPGRRFIFNVTSPEGRFDNAGFAKKAAHPHTNMAKAALNMLTKTIAVEFAALDVFVASCDTGWVSDMRPTATTSSFSSSSSTNDSNSQTESEYRVPLPVGARISPPLTIADGAARVIDPLMRGVRFEAPVPPFGVYLKDFQPVSW